VSREFHHRAVDMGLDGQRAHHELGGELVVGQASSDQQQHLDFSLCELR